MPKYQCPECEAILKRESAVEKGKKIKCPKCEMIFVAKAMPEEEDEEAAAPPPKKKAVKKTEPAKSAAAKSANDDDDNEEGGSYSVVEEKTDGEGDSRKKDLYFGSLRDKFAKSKRGPAMAELVTPSNFMMGEGIVICIVALVGFCASLWPFIFNDQSLPRDRVQRQSLFAVLCVLGFVVGGFICYAASCMHDLRFYSLVWAGCVVATLPLIGALVVMILYGGVKGYIWGYPCGLLDIFTYGVVLAMIKLSQQSVKDGFVETIEKANELKNG